MGIYRQLIQKQEKEEKPTTETLYLQQQNLILENAKKGAAFSVVILLDKSFPLLFGSKQGTLDAYKDFVPMNIQTRYLDMALGVKRVFQNLGSGTIYHSLPDRTPDVEHNGHRG